MVKVICDRCGKKMKNPMRNTRRSMCIYKNPIKSAYEGIDLCPDCQKEFADFTDLAESYFMNTKKNVTDIFEKSKYYKE